ncbi:PHP domain-containing protein [Fodinicola acaciae]|uniref:PHP domain-containing protein n=1 Tax=Fodinicola acaciae TaxID=2681555 RepID=UPI0013D0114D|nr:PHP domain-containing protein [Fodinicola acaciae]
MTEPRDALADLKRIAFLLEKAGESTYRVRAFRSAATAIAGRTDLAERAANGTLKEIKGVGEVTARCIAESVAGEEPVYLRRMEATGGEPVAAGGERIRAALRGDCHSHTDASDGGSPLTEMVIAAVELGHEYLVVTDHSPRLKVANGLSAERLRKQLDQIAKVNEAVAPFRVLTGIEVDINEDGTLDQEEELLAELDVVVASVHSKLRMPADEMTPRMLAAVSNPHVDILGHCTGRQVKGKSRPESQFDAKQVFAACADAGVAVEINCRPDRLDPPKRLLRLAIEAGCLMSIDSDAHAPGQLDWQPYGCERAALSGAPVERIVNTWPVDDLLAWSRERRLPA